MENGTTLLKANSKIQEICDTLRKETLLPAQKEAEQILERARERARSLELEACEKARQAVEEAARKIELDRAVFHASLNQASRQAIESLRQSILHKLFLPEIHHLVEEGMASSEIVAKLIEAVLQALEKEGWVADPSVYLPAHLSVKDIQQALSTRVLEKLKNTPLEVGNFKGGVQVKLDQKKLTIDITDQALKELLANYLKKPEFRELIFNN